MKGYIGIKFDPSYNLKVSSLGAGFVQRFRSLSTIGGTGSCFIDDTYTHVLNYKNSPNCRGLKFSSFAADGSFKSYYFTNRTHISCSYFVINIF